MGCALLAVVIVLSALAGANPIYYVLLVIGRAVWMILGDRPFVRRLEKLLIRLGWIFILTMATYIGVRWIIIKSTL